MPKHTKKTITKKTSSEKVVLLTSSEAQTGDISEHKKPAQKRGQKDEYDNKVKPYLSDIAKYHRCGVTEGQLAEYYDVGKTTWAKYKKEHPEFSETLLKAKQQLKTDLINQSFKVAMGYEYEEEKTETYFDKNGNNPAMPDGLSPDIEASDNPLSGYDLGSAYEPMTRIALEKLGMAYPSASSIPSPSISQEMEMLPQQPLKKSFGYLIKENPIK